MNASSFVESRPFGDFIVTVISEGELRFAPELAVPESEWRPAIPEVG